MADGTLLVQPTGGAIELYEGEFGMFHRQSVPIVRLSPEGGVFDTVAMLAGTEWFMTEPSEEEHPFQKLPCGWV